MATRNDTLKLAQLRFEDTPSFLQLRVGAKVADLNRTVTEFMNGRGQGGDFRVDADDSDLVDFNQVYEVEAHRTRYMQVYIKQTKLTVEENEDWIHVSGWMATAYGVPKCSLFRPYPADGNVQRLSGARDQDGAYSFDWIARKQYWWENVYNLGPDRFLNQGKEIRMIDATGRVDTLAIDRGWNEDEIAAHWVKLLETPTHRQVVVRRAGDSDYHWDFVTMIPIEPLECTLTVGPR
jgi:hypothetical protein